MTLALVAGPAYYTPKEAVARLNSFGCRHVTEASLAQMRHRGTGPEYEADGIRYILYSGKALYEWAIKRRRVGLWCTQKPGRPAPTDHIGANVAIVQGEDMGDIDVDDETLNYRDPDPFFDEITALLAQERGDLFE